MGKNAAQSTTLPMKIGRLVPRMGQRRATVKFFREQLLTKNELSPSRPQGFGSLCRPLLPTVLPEASWSWLQ